MLEAQSAVVDRLAQAVSGCVHLPGSDEYRTGVRIWNGAVTARPAAVARPRSAHDVQQVVGVAAEQNLPITVRGGGHDWAGRALNDGGVVVDMSAMRRVDIDSVVRVADVQGGATIDDVVRAAEPYGLTAPAGTHGDVGMVGFTLAGGHGPLNGITGLGLDNLVEAEVVLADGRLVTANANSEPDLFWALRGGGGNFGVVTRIRVRLHPLATMTTGVLLYPWEQAADVLRGFDAMVPSMPDELTVVSGVVSGPDGGPAVILAPTFMGNPETASSWVGELRRLGEPAVEQVAPISPTERLHLLDDIMPLGRHYEIRTANVATLSSAVIDALMHAASTRESPFSAVGIHHFHGASTRVGAADTAFGVRTPHFVLEVIAAWEPGEGAVHQQWAQALYASVLPDALPGGYPNLIGPAQRSQADAAYGPNAARLLAVKRQWDGATRFTATPLPSSV
jgi:FAD/FMN-containing dehydrogenase